MGSLEHELVAPTRQPTSPPFLELRSLAPAPRICNSIRPNETGETNAEPGSQTRHPSSSRFPFPRRPAGLQPRNETLLSARPNPRSGSSWYIYFFIFFIYIGQSTLTRPWVFNDENLVFFGAVTLYPHLLITVKTFAICDVNKKNTVHLRDCLVQSFFSMIWQHFFFSFEYFDQSVEYLFEHTCLNVYSIQPHFYRSTLAYPIYIYNCLK